MSSVIFWNVVLSIPFVLVFAGIPLWMSFRRQDRAPDHTAARRYLAAKQNLTGGAEPGSRQLRDATRVAPKETVAAVSRDGHVVVPVGVHRPANGLLAAASYVDA